MNYLAFVTINPITILPAHHDHTLTETVPEVAHCIYGCPYLAVICCACNSLELSFGPLFSLGIQK